MKWFESLARQKINDFVWFELDSLPWHLSYCFSADNNSSVILNNTLDYVKYWSEVLAMTNGESFFSLLLKFHDSLISHD